SSLKRRLRSALDWFHCSTLSALQDRLLHEEALFPALMQFLTIPVSDLFRDPSFFLSFRNEIVPVLGTYPSLRLWIAGCSTGEEAYSPAMVLAEEAWLGREMISPTDITAESRRVAAAGLYSLDRLEAFPENPRLSGSRLPLSEHYTAAYGSVVFSRALRERIV